MRLQLRNLSTKLSEDLNGRFVHPSRSSTDEGKHRPPRCVHRLAAAPSARCAPDCQNSPLDQVRTSKAMRTKIRTQRPSTETKRSPTPSGGSYWLKSAKTRPNKEVEPDTDTDSEDSIDVESDGPISAQKVQRAATTTAEAAGTARSPRTSPSWKQLFFVGLSLHPLWHVPHITWLWPQVPNVWV